MAKKARPANMDEGAAAMVRVLQGVESLRRFGPFDAGWVERSDGPRFAISLKAGAPEGLETKDLLKAEEVIRFAVTFLLGRVNPADGARMRRMHAQLAENATGKRVRVLELVIAARRELAAGIDEAVGNLRALLSWFVDTRFERLDERRIAALLRDKRKGPHAIAAELSLASHALGDKKLPGEVNVAAAKRVAKTYEAAERNLK